MSERVFLVGGAVRDRIMGLPTKDFDFAVETVDFDAMRAMVESKGGEVFVETPEFLTIRARDRKGLLTGQTNLTADFVLCRKDVGATDGRHPDEVVPGTIFDDLARRDFTVNAIAEDVRTGEIIDPHGGIAAIRANRLECVGDTATRMREDALRAIRAIRFSITKGFDMDAHLMKFLMEDPDLPDLLNAVSDERKREELHKCFRHDTLRTMNTIAHLRVEMQEAIIPDSLWLKPTSEKRN